MRRIFNIATVLLLTLLLGTAGLPVPIANASYTFNPLLDDSLDNIGSNNGTGISDCASTNVHCVDGGGTAEYTTIATALTASDSGDEVIVMPGTYAESNLSVPHGVDILGLGRRRNTLISATFNGPILLLASGNNVIRNIGINNGSTGASSTAIGDGGVGVTEVSIENVLFTCGGPSCISATSATYDDWILNNVRFDDRTLDSIQWNGIGLLVKNSYDYSTPGSASEASFLLTGSNANINARLENNEIKVSRSSNEGDLDR